VHNPSTIEDKHNPQTKFISCSMQPECMELKVRACLAKQLRALRERNNSLRRSLPDSSVKPKNVPGRPDMKQLFSMNVAGDIPKRRQSLKVGYCMNKTKEQDSSGCFAGTTNADKLILAR
jgi:hypothetical protein